MPWHSQPSHVLQNGCNVAKNRRPSYIVFFFRGLPTWRLMALMRRWVVFALLHSWFLPSLLTDPKPRQLSRPERRLTCLSVSASTRAPTQGRRPMRGLRESLRLLALRPALAAALSPQVAAAAGGALAAAAAPAALQREAAALRRWLHSGACRSAWQQQLSAAQQQQGARLAPSVAADARQLCLRRWMSSRPRGRKELMEGTSKKNTDQGWYIVSRPLAACLAGRLEGVGCSGVQMLLWSEL